MAANTENDFYVLDRSVNNKTPAALAAAAAAAAAAPAAVAPTAIREYNKLMKVPGNRVNRARILTALAVADAAHDGTNNRGFLTYLQCEPQAPNIKTRDTSNDFKDTHGGEDNALEGVFGPPVPGTENFNDNYYWSHGGSGLNSADTVMPLFSHSLEKIRDKYTVAMIGINTNLPGGTRYTLTADSSPHFASVPADQRGWNNATNYAEAQGFAKGSVDYKNAKHAAREQAFINMQTQFRQFLEEKSFSFRNICYHYDAFRFGVKAWGRFLNPDNTQYKPIYVITRASITDPATKPAPESEKELWRDGSWNCIHEKKDKDKQNPDERYVYNQVRDCTGPPNPGNAAESVNSWKDSLVSKQKVTHMLPTFHEAYLKLEKKGTGLGARKRKIYYDGKVAAKPSHKKDGQSKKIEEIKAFNREKFNVKLTNVISGSHALAKRCGDWCQATQTKRTLRHQDYKIWRKELREWDNINTTATDPDPSFNVTESNTIQCLVTHDRILKAYALSIGVPMLIFSKASSGTRGPGIEVYIDRSYQSKQQNYLNKLSTLRQEKQSAYKEARALIALINLTIANLRANAADVRNLIRELLDDISQNITWNGNQTFQPPPPAPPVIPAGAWLRRKLSGGEDNFYIQFIKAVAALYDIVFTHKDALRFTYKILTPGAPVPGADSLARINTSNTSFDNVAGDVNTLNTLEHYINNQSQNPQDAICNIIDASLNELKGYIRDINDEIGVLKLAADGLAAGAGPTLKTAAQLFTNKNNIEWCSPLQIYYKPSSTRPDKSILNQTSPLPEKLCLDYVKKIKDISENLPDLFPSDASLLLAGEPPLPPTFPRSEDTIFHYLANPDNTDAMISSSPQGWAVDSATVGGGVADIERCLFYNFQTTTNPTGYTGRTLSTIAAFMNFFCANIVSFYEYAGATSTSIYTMSGGGKLTINQKGGAITWNGYQFETIMNEVSGYFYFNYLFSEIEKQLDESDMIYDVSLNAANIPDYYLDYSSDNYLLPGPPAAIFPPITRQLTPFNKTLIDGSIGPKEFLIDTMERLFKISFPPANVRALPNLLINPSINNALTNVQAAAGGDLFNYTPGSPDECDDLINTFKIFDNITFFN